MGEGACSERPHTSYAHRRGGRGRGRTEQAEVTVSDRTVRLDPDLLVPSMQPGLLHTVGPAHVTVSLRPCKLLGWLKSVAGPAFDKLAGPGAGPPPGLGRWVHRSWPGEH